MIHFQLRLFLVKKKVHIINWGLSITCMQKVHVGFKTHHEVKSKYTKQQLLEASKGECYLIRVTKSNFRDAYDS